MINKQLVFKKIVSPLLLLMVFSVVGFSQNIELHGQIVDAETNEAIEFANIGVVGTYMGTASDFNGHYQLTVGESFKNYKVQISAVGYLVKEFTVDELFVLKGEGIKLFPQTYGIQQVEVKADSKRLYGILKTASNLIEDSYSKAYSAQAYYKQVVSEKTTEAVVYYADSKGYGNRSLASANDSKGFDIVEVRKDFEASPIQSGLVHINELLMFDIVRQRGNVLDKDFVDDYKLSLIEEAKLDGDSVWVIKYELDNPDVAKTGDAYCEQYNGIIYVNQKDYAIIRNEINFISNGFFHAGRDAYRSVSDQTLDYTVKVIANYRKGEDDKYALSKIKYNGSGGSDSNELQWIIYKVDASIKAVDKQSFYADKDEDEDFWNRFTLPAE